MNKTLEMAFKLWTDDSGEHIYIGEDADGFQCVEIRYVDSTGVIGSRISFNPKDAAAIAESIVSVAKHITNRTTAP